MNVLITVRNSRYRSKSSGVERIGREAIFSARNSSRAVVERESSSNSRFSSSVNMSILFLQLPPLLSETEEIKELLHSHPIQTATETSPG
jgi:hypothetical protein